MAKTLPHNDQGRRMPALLFSDRIGKRAAGILLAAAIVLLALSGAAGAREFASRSGSTAGQAVEPAPAAPQDAVSEKAEPAPASAGGGPVELLILPEAGPLAADGAGRLFMLGGHGGGYDLLRLADEKAGEWETVYRRKSGVATSLALGRDGTICIGLLSGVDCIDPLGRVAHYAHELLAGIVSLAIAPDGHVWALRSPSGGTLDLELVRATPGVGQVRRVLTLRQSVQGFAGNGLAAAPDGSVLLPVVENGVHRVFRVQPDGRFSRVGDFWQLGGGIALARGETMFLAGVKRPQSLEEQRNPVEAVFAQVPGGAAGIFAPFPQSPGGPARFESFTALGGDGTLYVVRRQPVRAVGGSPTEAPVLWKIPVGIPSLQGAGAKAIEFSIPYIESLATLLMPDPAEYGGPLMVAEGMPVEIAGINFEGKDGARRVLMGGVPARVIAWTENAILAAVPSGLKGGPAELRVAIDEAVSDPEWFEVKTPDIPGWFQVGTPSMRAAIAGNRGISGYTGLIAVEGTTERGDAVRLEATMETPGLWHVRLPNGTYTASFRASYLVSEVVYGGDFSYQGSRFSATVIEEQAIEFVISDLMPAVVWVPQML